jgi:hydrogenase-1 operon protein HyaF
MSGLDNISVRVEQTPAPADIAIAQSILHEIHALLERLLAEGVGGAIDLRSLPALNPASLGLLEEWLPAGEVSAVVVGTGKTEIRETAYAGVWWLVHHNAKGELLTESIEIGEVPDILKSQREDVESGLRRLGGALSAAGRQELAG